MQTFEDADGRKWTVRLTAYAISRVREQTGLDLFAVLDTWPEGAKQLSSDPALFVNAVYLLATAAKDAPALSAEDFCRAVDGAVLDAMSESFYAAVLDFFRRSPRGPALAKVHEKAKTLQSLLAGKALKEAEAMDPAKMLDGLLSKNGSTASPASSALTPDPSPSGS